jgi:hypothetical protein
MIPLAIDIAVPDEQTRLTLLDIDNTSPLLSAALSAAACRHAYHLQPARNTFSRNQHGHPAVKANLAVNPSLSIVGSQST